MGRAVYTNNAIGTLASGIVAGSTSISLTAGQGALFPSLSGTDYFYATLYDVATGTSIEIVKCTARSTDTLTVTRAQQGTTAKAYSAGDRIAIRPTASGYSELAPIDSPTFTGHITTEGVTATGATGTGKFVFDTSPTLATPTLGVATVTTINKVTVTQPATGATLTISDGKTLAANNTLTLAGTDSTTMTFPPVSASVGYINIPQQSKSANYTTVLGDSGYHIFHPSSDANARTFTIDSNANVAYATGTAITFINLSANSCTIAITSDTMYLAGTGTTGSRTLAQYGVATAVKVASTTWIISGTGLT